MSKAKNIEVLAAISQEDMDRRGADISDEYVDTIAEAKRRAKYYLTEEFMNG